VKVSLPYVDTIARTSLGRVLMMSHVCARPWRADPESVAYQARVYAGSPSFVRTLQTAKWTDVDVRALQRVRCPFTVAWGTRDVLLIPRMAHRWARIVPGARLVWLRGLGHIPMSDDPDLVARTILDGAATPAPSPPAAAPAAR
jgi:pimeloyl-ACP methyl ester carboxylesterase